MDRNTIKEKEVRQKSPYLILLPNQTVVQVQVEWGHEFKSNCPRGEACQGQVHTGHHWNALVPEKHGIELSR